MIRKRLLVFGVISIAVSLLSFVILDDRTSIQWYTKIAYPLTLLAYVTGVIAYFRSPMWNPSALRELFRPSMIPVWLLFFVLAIHFVVSGNWGFKTVMDEPLIAATSQNLHFNRVPLFPWRAYNIEGTFTIVDSYLDKRPIAFAVLISLLHDLTGYRPENAFILNNIIGVLCFGLAGWLGYRVHRRMGACLGMLLISSLPAIHHYANGAGFDVFNIFMIMLVMALAMGWYQDRSDWSMTAFLFAGVILCQSRYEAALFAVPIGAVVLYQWWRQRSFQLPWTVCLVPVMMMLIPLQQAVFNINKGFWELESKPEADSIFGLQYFYPNLGHAINYFWDWTDIYPNSPYLFIGGVLALVFLAARVLPRIREFLEGHPERAIWLLFSAGLLFHFFLMMIYFYGQFDSGMLHRFSLPSYLLLIFGCLWGLRLLPRTWMKQGWLAVFVVGWIAYTVPVNAKQFYQSNYIPTVYGNWVRNFAKKNEDKNFLIVDRNPIPWILYGISATNYQTANTHASKFKYQLEKGHFDDVLVVNLLGRDPKSGNYGMTAEDRLSESYSTEFISKKFLHPFFVVHLERIVDVDVEKAETEAQMEEKEIEGEQETVASSDEITTEDFKFSINRLAQEEYYLNLP